MPFFNSLFLKTKFIKRLFFLKYIKLWFIFMETYEITDRISLVFLNDRRYFCFKSNDGFGAEDEKYFFGEIAKVRKVTKTGKRGGKVKVNQKYKEFHAVGYSESSSEVYNVLNLERFQIGSYEFYCPSSWRYKIEGDLTVESIEQYLNFDGDDAYF